MTIGPVIAVAPAFNEERKIGEVVRKLKACAAVDRTIVVDDGSTDGTAAEAEAAGAEVLRQPKNAGVGAALRAGFKAARARGAAVIVVLGGDDQDNPDEIPRLLGPLKAGFDFVQGSRWTVGGKTENIPLFRRVTTRLYSLLFRWCTGFPSTDGTNGFRAFRANILDRIDLEKPWLNAYELEPFLFYHAAKFFKTAEVPVTKRYPAKGGESYTKMVPFKSWWSILRPLILLKLGLKK